MDPITLLIGGLAAGGLYLVWRYLRRRRAQQEEEEKKRQQQGAAQRRTDPKQSVQQQVIVRPSDRELSKDKIIQRLLEHITFTQERVVVGHRQDGVRVIGMERREVPYPTDLADVRQIRGLHELPLRLPAERTSVPIMQLVRAASGEAQVMVNFEDEPLTEPVLVPEYRVKRKVLYLLLDISGSMFGRGGANPAFIPIWKAFVIQLLRRAIASEAVVLMRYFDGNAYDLKIMQSLAAVETVVEEITGMDREGGGTNITGAIDAALADLAEQHFDEADIMIVSDGEDDTLKAADVREKLSAAKARVHAVMFGTQNQRLLESADFYQSVPRPGEVTELVTRT